MTLHPASVEVAGLTVRYGDLVAVDDVSFTAAAGQVTAVLGPNGAGKTSTIEVCEGYRRAAGGSVRVLGLDPATHQRQLSERMGVMLQDGGVYPSATVARTIKHYCDLYQRGADPETLIQAVGLTDRANGTWRRLSGGERQRLSLALALAAVPDVAFLDEPTAGVDINGRDAIRAIIADLRERGCVVVLATHELDEAERLADHVVIIDRGKLVASGSLASLGDGHQRITFRSAPHLDVAALSERIGTTVIDAGDGSYRIDGTADASTVAALTSWLAEHDAALTAMTTGGERLEDVFRRLTADQNEADEADQTDGSGTQPTRPSRRTRRGKR